MVATNDKRRFAVEGTRIRASQGHSVEVDLGLPAATPPSHLYHGTVASNLDAIRAEGLRPMNRHDVHLSPDRETATRVGARRGRPVVLGVDAGRHAPRRPCLPGQRERGVAHRGRAPGVSAVPRPALKGDRPRSDHTAAATTALRLLPHDLGRLSFAPHAPGPTAHRPPAPPRLYSRPHSTW